MNANTPVDAFDATAEVRSISSLLLRHTALLVTSSSQRRIVSGLCEALTASTPNILLAWTWFGASDTLHIRPQIVAGAAAGYADSLLIADDPVTRTGPVFRALSNQPTWPSVVSESSAFVPWREAYARYGIRSSLALPLRSKTDGFRGVFVLYARHPDYFERVGVPLFEALAELFAALLSAASGRSALEAAAQSDALTGLGNRRLLGAAERAVYRPTEASAPASLLLLDIDHFKSINDRHGHRMGDDVLREMARVLRARLRREDWVMRWGGEEFLVVVPETGLAQALVLAEALRASVAASPFGDSGIALTVSIGVAELGVRMPLSAAIEAADLALYAAKRAGRDRVVPARGAEEAAVAVATPAAAPALLR